VTSAKDVVIPWKETWERVKKLTGWENQTELAHFLDITSTSVSQSKGGNKFLVGWLYKIGAAYGANFHWLLTGEGLMKDEQERPAPGPFMKDKTVDYSVNIPLRPELQTVLDAVTEIMMSGNEVIKGALVNNIAAFQQAVENAQKIVKLERNLEAIKLMLNPEDPPTDVKEE